MSRLHPVIGLWVLLLFFVSTGTEVSGMDHEVVSIDGHGDFGYNEEEIERRVGGLSLSVNPKCTKVVKSYINGYVVRNRPKSSMIIGRTELYFPLFEKYLQQYGLPDDLKYITIVESALDPGAVSRSGAVGLWQFMKPTARDMDLTINKYVDERRDPERSTEAAVRYLAQLYERFGDWEIVLAAYNAGPGTLSRAIKRHRTSDYWTLRKHLPRETRSYVPAFIAASYLMKYHYMHGLNADDMDADMLRTQTHRLYETTSFQEISILSGVQVDVIKMLNPSFIRHLVPGSDAGTPVRLPQAGMEAYLAAISIPESYRSPMLLAATVDEDEQDLEFFETITEKMYKVKSGDNLYDLSRAFDCKVSDLVQWNNLRTHKLRIGQELMVMMTEKLYIKRLLLPTLDYVPGRSDIPSAQQQLQKYSDDYMAAMTVKTGSNANLCRFHQMQRGQSLLDVAALYPTVTLEHILSLNQFELTSSPKPGQKIVIAMQ